MLDDENVVFQQYRVDGPAIAAAGIVNIVGVDTDQIRSLVAQICGGFSRQEWMGIEIRRRIPMFAPAGVNENRFARDVGILSADVPYKQVVATQFSPTWREPEV